MILYHSSSFVVEKPDVFHSRNNLDFGKGFYLTTLREQAVKYAERFLLRGKKAYLNTYELAGDFHSVLVKSFASYDGEWLDFVSSCRKGVDSEKFDLVIGGIADDKVFRTIDLYLAGDMSREEALKRLRYERPNNQYCIRSQKVIDTYLTFVKTEEII